MQQDAWRAYLELALGMTEASRKKATKVAKRLAGKGGATAEQLQAMGEELVKTSLANREAITKLVRFELDRALSRVGLATVDEVKELTARVRDLERQLREASALAVGPRPADATGASVLTGVSVPPSHEVAQRAVKKAAARKAVAKKAVAKKAVAKKAVAKKAVAKKSAPPVAPVPPPAEGDLSMAARPATARKASQSAATSSQAAGRAKAARPAKSAIEPGPSA